MSSGAVVRRAGVGAVERRRTVRPLAVVLAGAGAEGAAGPAWDAAGSAIGTGSGAAGVTEGAVAVCSAACSPVWSVVWSPAGSVARATAFGGAVRDAACGTGWAAPGSTIRFFGRTTMARVPW
ncbi:hypothetical protein SVIOM342S_06253 [Streptomyces violaceorubidus]